MRRLAAVKQNAVRKAPAESIAAVLARVPPVPVPICRQSRANEAAFCPTRRSTRRGGEEHGMREPDSEAVKYENLHRGKQNT